LGKEFSLKTLKRFLDKLSAALRTLSSGIEVFALMQEQSRQEHIGLFYGDESLVSPECVSYAWKYEDEQVCTKSVEGKDLNCFALISRDNRIIRYRSRACHGWFHC